MNEMPNVVVIKSSTEGDTLVILKYDADDCTTYIIAKQIVVWHELKGEVAGAL